MQNKNAVDNAHILPLRNARASEMASTHKDPTQPILAVRGMQAYEPIASSPRDAFSGPNGAFKLDWNEATVPPSPKVRTALADSLSRGRGLNFYPPLENEELLNDLSRYTGVDASQILVTSGSDEALRVICETFLSPGDVVAVPEPTYGHFLLFAKACGAQIKSLVSEDPFRTDLELLTKALEERPRMLYLVNPNNPTGTVYTRAELEQLLDAATHTLVIIDEAYFEFWGESAMWAIARYPNVIITRTFSKAFGLAALRVGYLAAPEPVVASLKVLHNPKSVNTFAQVAARAALSDMEHLRGYVHEVRKGRTLLAGWLRERGFTVREGEGNFLCFKVDAVAETCARLVAARVFVRDRSSAPGLAGYIRVSIGTVAQTEWLIDRLERVLF